MEAVPARGAKARPGCKVLAHMHMFTCGLFGMVIDSTDNDELNFELGCLFLLIPVQEFISDSICQLLEMHT